MKGLFIPEITAEEFRNGCLESIEALMAEGAIYDIEYPQPCEDCISRSAVLEKKQLVELDDGQSFYCINPKDVKTLPSVTPQQTRFIPVSERMPEKTDYYLIQYSREVCPDEMAVAFYSIEEAEVDSNYTWEFKPIADCKEVIAWQPLPESYEEGSRKE